MDELEFDDCSASIDDKELKIESYKKHCLGEKIAFYKIMNGNPKLLRDKENRLRYRIYIDDVVEYYVSKLKEDVKYENR